MSPDTAYYRGLARTYATQHGIDEDIFERLINQESGFNPTAGSYAGAQGIAQIMPSAHPGVDPWDPVASLDYAAGLISGYLRNNQGDIRKALTSYHAGSGILARAVELGGAGWEGSIYQAAVDQGYPSEAERIARDNATYLTSILGGGSISSETGAPYTGLPLPPFAQPPFMERPTAATFTADYRDRLNHLVETVFGRPEDEISSEPFPGYRGLMSDYEHEYYVNQGRQEILSQQLEELRPPTGGSILQEAVPGRPAELLGGIIDVVLPGGAFFGWLPGELGGPYEEAQEAYQEQLNIILQEQDQLLAKQSDLGKLFAAVNAQVAVFSERDPDIRAEAQAALDAMVGGSSSIQQEMMGPLLQVVRGSMEEYIEDLSSMTPEELAGIAQADITEKLFEENRARPVASYLLSTEQLRLSLKGFRSAGPSEEATGEQIRQALMDMGLDSEEAEAYRQDTVPRVQALLDQALEVEQNIAAIRAGLADWTPPRPGSKDYFKAMLMQPFLVATEGLDKYFRGVVHPITGAGLYSISQLIPGEQEIETNMDIALGDNNFWDASREAWQANTWHPVAKFALETAFDPTSYIGWGIATKLVKPLPVIGRPMSRVVGAAEYGFLRAADAPFRLLGAGVSKIPKPTATLARMARGDATGTITRYLSRSYPTTKPSRITGEQATTALQQALEREKVFPEMLADLGVQTARILRAMPAPQLDEALEWSAKAGGSMTREVALRSKTLLSDLNTLLVHAADNPNEASTVARQLMPVLGVEDTAKGFRSVQGVVNRYMKKGELQAQRLAQGEKAFDMIRRIGDHTSELTTFNRSSQSALIAEQRGILALPLSRLPEGAGAVWGNTIEKFLIVPMARSYLLFSMYHLWNVAETRLKIALAGKNPFHRGNPSQMFYDAFADSVGADVEVLMGRGRSLVLGETVDTVDAARNAVEAFVAPGWLRKAFLESTAIKSQAHSQAWFQYQLAVDEFKRLKPREWGMIEKAMSEVGMDFKFLPRDLRPWAKDATTASILQGPEFVRNLPAEATVERLRAFNVERLLSKYDMLDAKTQEFIVAQAESGRLFTDTDAVAQEVLDTVWEKHLRSPEFFANNFEDMVDEVLTAPIATWEDFAKRLLTMQSMSRNYGRILMHQYDVAMEASSKVVRATDNDRIWTTWMNASDEFGNRAQVAMDRYTEVMRSRIAATGDRATDIEFLISRYDALRNMQRNAFAERNAIARQRLLVEAPAGSKKRTYEWWAKVKEEMREPFHRIGGAEGALTQEIYGLEARIGHQPKYPIPDATGRAISRADVAILYGMRPDDVSSMLFLTDLQAIMGKDEFIEDVINRAIINMEPGQDITKLGWTHTRIGEVWDDIMRELRLDPRNVSAIAPTHLQIDDMSRAIRLEGMAAGLDDAETAAFRGWADNLASKLDNVGGYSSNGAVTPDWLATKGEALQSATDEFYVTFPDYIHTNYLDAFMRSQMPYWTYEFHRLFYIPRQFMRTPGLLTGLGRYNEHTGGDNYIHVPFTSLEVNPLRGTILMGGLRRLLVRDFPEYYDTFPGAQQVMDIAGRWGFYPGAHVSIGNVALQASKGGRSQVGELVPTWMKAPVQGFQAFAQATGSQTMIDASTRLANLFIPERFRDYMIAMKVSEIGSANPDTGELVSGADILNKMLADSPLEEHEQELWDRASGELGTTFILMDQTAMFRFRPEELTEARKEYDIIVSEYTGYPIEQLEQMRAWGVRWQDMVPPTPEVRDFLNATESLQRWSGFTNVLFGASEQNFRARRNEFWDEIDSAKLDLRTEQEVIDCRFGFAGATGCDHPGSITARTWKDQHGELGSRYRVEFDRIKALDRYKDIPVTHEEVVAFYESTGQPLPTEHPSNELYRMYYDIQLEEKLDPETGALALDFDTFYIQREILLQAAGDQRDELEERISRNESDLEKLHRWSYVQYLRPYYNRRDLTIERFPIEAQLIIRRWLVSGQPLERERLEQVQYQDRSLIGAYQDDLKLSGKNLRFYSPDIDSWLAFWQVTDSFATDEGQRRYEQLMRQYRPDVSSIIDIPPVEPPELAMLEDAGGGSD